MKKKDKNLDVYELIAKILNSIVKGKTLHKLN